MKKIMALLLAALFLLGCFSGCGSKDKTETKTDPAADGSGAETAGTGDKPAIHVGSKDYSEQLILGQITLQYLESKGYECIDKTNVAGSDTCWNALKSGDFDVYWDYTGTIWGSFLGQTDFPEGGEAPLYEAVVEGLAEENECCVGDMMNINNTYGLVVTKEVAELGITTFSELGAYMTEHPGELVFCGDHEFTIREDGLLGLSDAYGIDFGQDLNVMDMGLVFQALKDGQGDVGMVFCTDARILDDNLVLLKDDKSYFPSYNAVPCFRTEFAEQYPEVVELMNDIAGLIDNDEMISLNAKVDIDGEEPEDVAADWLLEVGLVS